VIYSQSLTIPPNVSQANPVYTAVYPTCGFLRSISLLFPDGCKGAVGVRVFDWGQQIIPVNGWIADNDKDINMQVNRKLQGPPFQLFIQGYSLAVDWPHTIGVRLEITQ
jgi:hypothetical protein